MNTPAINEIKTMSSTEIAQLTAKQKTHIHRDIKDQLFIGLYELKDDPNLDDKQIQGITIILDNRGYWSEVLLDKYHTDILVSGYEVKYRAKIIKRWHELEEKASQPQINPANLTRMQLIQIALEAEQELQEERAKTALLEPKANALDRIATETDGALNPTDSAKILQFQPKKLFNWLSAHRWIYKRPGGRHWLGYQDKIQAGLVEHKEKEITLDDGSKKISCQVFITAKGLAKLSELLTKDAA